MSARIIHISDIHLKTNWEEEQGVVLESFFLDLESQLDGRDNCYIIFSGDIVQSGSDKVYYEHFKENFAKRLANIGLGKNKLIVTPGNHDLDRDYTKKNFVSLMALQKNDVDETTFNNAIYSEFNNTVGDKFLNFIRWNKDISDFCLDENSFAGKGFSISEDIGVYCLNTALYSFGGLRDENDNKINDDRRLPIETRELNKWVQKNNHKYRILVMHHPKAWLLPWARKGIEKITKNSFDLVLSGHTHKGESLNQNDGSRSVIECVAPPLFTRKNEELGYGIIDIDSQSKSTKIYYRQWFEDKFLLGVGLSKTEDGSIHFINGQKKVTAQLSQAEDSLVGDTAQSSVDAYLENKFSDSLSYHRSLPEVWVIPNLSDTPENSQLDAPAVILSADMFSNSLEDCVIKSPPQFGLTALGRFLALHVWKRNPGKYVIFLNSVEINNYESAIKKTISAHLKERGLNDSNLHAIILDEDSELDERKIKNIKNSYPDIPLIILFRIDDQQKIGRSIDCTINHTYKERYLWSLDRSQVREVVTKFIEAGYHLNEDESTQRLADDLENLNLHRTPLNCAILLAVYQQQMDSNPANRTEMLEKFLNLIFSNYKKRNDYSNFPDMKDSFYVLGALSEQLLTTEGIVFSKSYFLSFSAEYCLNMAVDVDTDVLFDILLSEKIIVERIGGYSFRYVHWLYFFAAHRMHHDSKFRDFIIEDARYISYPEIIEFYSGIDRRREELIDVLIRDLSNLNKAFEDRTKIEANFDPYAGAKWKPTTDDIKALQSHIENETKQSTLPKQERDTVADNGYDRSRPYIQELAAFVRDSSLYECMQVMKASSRALRNSDYVSPDKKQDLLREIVRAWSKIFQILVLLAPFLAEHKKISFEHLEYYLDNSFDNFDGDDLWKALLSSIPANVIDFYEKDFASARMTPLIKRYLSENTNEIEGFILISNLIRQKPRDWLKIVKGYMEKLDKNSFYLLSIFKDIKREYRYGFCDTVVKGELENLLGFAIAKHQLKQDNPGIKMIKKAAQAVIKDIKKNTS